MKVYRNNGAVGALLDEYEKAINEMQSLIESVSENDLVKVIDEQADKPESRSLQSILSHVVKAGNWYNIEMKKALGESLENPESRLCTTVAQYSFALQKMFNETEQTFKNYPEMDIYCHRDLRWKQIVNIDLLMEHAIVHILRHRRQIERIVLKNVN